MASLTFLVLVLGVVLPCVLGADKPCPDKGDGSVDWTQKEETWYYCQTTLEGPIKNCYIDFKPTGPKELSGTVYQIGKGSTPTDPFKMKTVAEGKYDYPERKTSAINIAVASEGDGKCLTYWKCPQEGADWNGVKPKSSYFMFMCNKASLCKPQKEYQGKMKEIFDKAAKEYDLKDIKDLPQKECAEKYGDKYKM